MKKFKLLKYLYEEDGETEIPISQEPEQQSVDPNLPLGAENQPPQDYQDPNAMGGDPNAAPGLDPYGMPIEEPLSPEDIGKVYMLLKLHSRIEALNKLLDELPNEKYKDIKFEVAEALELFKIVSLNYDSFKQDPKKINNIIKQYKDFVYNITNKIQEIGDY